MTPGFRTTEFWLTVFTNVFALITIFFHVSLGSPKLIDAASIVAAAVVNGCYALARAHTKAGHSGAVAQVRTAEIGHQTVTGSLPNG